MEGAQYPASLNVDYFLRVAFEALFTSGDGTFFSTPAGEILYGVWYVYVVLAIIASGFFIFFYIRNMLSYNAIEAEMKTRFVTKTFDELDRASDKARYEHVLSLVESPKSSDWRQGIIEADIMLEEILMEQGYEGSNVQERLQNVDEAKFPTLSQAIRAHEVRARLHDEAFALDNRTAYQAFKNYEAVFKAFNQA